MTESAQQDHTIEAEASRWRVLLASGEATIEDRLAFDEWLHADPRHRPVYEDADHLWQTMAQMEHLREHLDQAQNESAVVSIQSSAVRRGMPEKALQAASYAAAAVVLIAVALWAFLYQMQPQVEQYATGVAETRDIVLDDGSAVTLGARSTVHVAYSDSQRRLELVAGEAFFSVAADANRPFVVAAGDSAVRVLGTMFDVHRGPAELRVAVQQGTVEVIHNGRPQQQAKHILSAGQQLVADHNSADSEIRQISPEQTGAWRSGRLIYDNTSLREIVADANRYSNRRVELADPELAKLKVTGSYRTDRIEQMVNGLAKILPIEIDDRTWPGKVILKDVKR